MINQMRHKGIEASSVILVHNKYCSDSQDICMPR